jgi:exosortase/archaeosortase family protein
MEDQSFLKPWIIRASIALVLGLVANTWLFTPGNAVDFYLTKYISIASGEFGALFTNEIYKAEDLNGGFCVTNKSLDRVYVGDGCNARNIILLYMGFVLTIPFGTRRNKFNYLTIGTLAIIIFNILRITILFLLAAKMPVIFKMMHKYVFQLSIYLLLFGLWHHYIKRYSPFFNEETGQA